MIVDIAIKTISHLGVEMKTAAFYVKLYYKQEFKIWKSQIDFENIFLLSSHALKL